VWRLEPSVLPAVHLQPVQNGANVDEISRDATAAQNRATEAGLDQSMTFELFDKSAKVTYDKRMLAELASLRFLEAHRHVVILGPVGVEKTFAASALGHVACRHGYHVRLIRADAMLQLLRKSRFDNSRDAEIGRAHFRRLANSR
jgi:DNA replication protein DnaC